MRTLSSLASAVPSVLRASTLPNGPFPTPDPFLFCVYHKDDYPVATDDSMEAPRRGDGNDFNPAAPYRMYHGDKVPGFPQHPHRGFETITATIDGIIDHADSLGNAGRYGRGDVQWMTAGKGILHGEMFPLVSKERPNATRFFQIWLNLPRARKMVDPTFAMFWAHEVPKWESPDGLAKATVWAGNYFLDGKQQNKPPPDSWAFESANDVAVIHITLQPGAKFILPKAHKDTVHRSLYVVEGSQLCIDGNGNNNSEEAVDVSPKVCLEVDPTTDMHLAVPPHDNAHAVEVLVLQGQPIQEPVEQYGPFVMNTRQEIQEAFQDYRQTQFGGWPWPREDMIFDRTKGRFALLNGNETFPRGDDNDAESNEKVAKKEEL